MAGPKATTNKAFLIDAWNDSINSTKRPPKNRQELYDIAKAAYACSHDGADFTCSTNDLSDAMRALKKEFYSNTVSSNDRNTSNTSIKCDDEDASCLYAELKSVCDTMQERIKRSACLFIGAEINARLAFILNKINEAKAKLDNAKELLKANNVHFNEADLSLSDNEQINYLEWSIQGANEGYYSDYEQSLCLTEQGAKCLNLVLKNVVPVLDSSLDDFVKKLSSLSNESVNNADKLPSEQVNHEAPKADYEATLESLDDAATKQATIKKPSKRTAKAKKQAPSKEATKATDNAGNEPLNDADKGILQPQSMEGAGDAMEAIKQDESYQALSSEEPSTPVAKSSKTAKTTKSNSRAKKSTKQEPVKGDTKPSNTTDTSAKKPRSKSKAPARKDVEESNILDSKVEDVTEEDQARLAKLVKP